MQITWCHNMESAMTSGQLAKDVLEADEQLAIHQERKAEIDGRYPHQTSLKVINFPSTPPHPFVFPLTKLAIK